MKKGAEPILKRLFNIDVLFFFYLRGFCSWLQVIVISIHRNAPASKEIHARLKAALHFSLDFRMRSLALTRKLGLADPRDILGSGHNA